MPDPEVVTTSSSEPPAALAWRLPRSLHELSREHPDIVAELIDMFLCDSVERLNTIGRSAADRATASREAHSIKGASQQLGADELAALCRRLELQAGALSPADFTTLVGELRREFDLVAGAMRPCGDRLRAAAPPPG
jgi:HPt (histidine-containing phosphotransfer) domain-containing protein